jgi:hypothetical protein
MDREVQERATLSVWLRWGFTLSPSWLATLAGFWPHKDAQSCCLLRISEYCFDRSA